MSDSGAELRLLLAQERAYVCPGVVSPLFARMAEDAGFEMIYATGAGIANAVFGLPDLGLLGMQEVLGVTASIVANCRIPVIADVDTGYGGTLNVVRTIREFDRAGVAAVQLEDQVQPKRCGHFDGKQVVTPAQMIERITAAKEARGSSSLVLIARTDALATEGVGMAIHRAQQYADAGADAVFVEAPTTVAELARIPREVPVPVVVNMVEGGRTPTLPAETLEEMGYRIVLYANAALRSAMAATRAALQHLRENGGTAAIQDDLISWDDRQAAVRLTDWLRLDDCIADLSRQTVDKIGLTGTKARHA